MKKMIRLSIPFIAACLMLGMTFYMAEASSQAAAAPYPSTSEGAILVTTLEDELNSDGDCSLREAIAAANNNTPVDACRSGEAVITDTITFEVAGTITVTSQLSVTAGGSLVIDGGGVISTSGGGATRVWWVETGSELTLRHLSVTDGSIEGSGAGLYNNAASVTIVQSQFIGNRLLGDSFFGGAIYNLEGTMVVYDSLFNGNGLEYYTGRVYGGGIAFQGGTGEIIRTVFQNNTALGECDWFFVPGGGGIYISSASLSIQESSFSNNVDLCYGGGIAIESGSVILANSTMSGNNSLGGGAICNAYGTVTIINSTLTDNSASYPSGNSRGGAIANHGTMEVTNSTLSGNNAEIIGGGAIENGGTLTATNSIVANSPTGGDCYGTITDGGHNISSDDTCGFDPANGSMPNTDPLLGSLQDNGGPTWPHAVLEGSPAIDAGDDVQCPSSDQRSIPRPIDGDGDGIAVCDIGSYELEGPPVTPTLVTITGPSEGFAGPALDFTATVEPISTTLPLTIVWQASGHPPITETRGLTDTVGWAWEMPGTQVITVTASNLGGSVMDTHVITITAPLYDLYLPLVIKTSQAPLTPASSLPGSGVLVVLVVFGAVSRWKRRW